MTTSDSLCVDSTVVKDATDLNLSSYKGTTSRTLAELLDQKFKSSTAPSSKSYNNGTTATPNTDKAWIPLSESTPVGNAQPKDILKAKSRLSRLSESVHSRVTSAQEGVDDSDDSDEDNEDNDSGKVQDHDQTPSKPQRSSPKPNVIQSKLQSELDELKRFKDYVSSIENGSQILKSFNSSSQNDLSQNELVVLTKDDLSKSREENNNLQDQNKSKTETIESLRADLEALKDKNRSYADTQKVLEESLESLKSTNQNQSKLTESLKEELESLKSKARIDETLNEEIAALRSSNSDLKEALALKEVSTSALHEKINTLNSQLASQQEDSNQRGEEVDLLKKELDKVRGDLATKVSPERFTELGKPTTNGTTIYEDLELPTVDELSQIEAQNFIKNVLINLKLPYGKTQQQISKLSRALDTDDILSEFVQKTHKLLYDSEIRLNSSQTQDSKRHLEQCTSQMYHNIELLYNGLKQHS